MHTVTNLTICINISS